MTRVIAHRGSAHHAPENSVAAFLDARRLGADGIELDVRRSVDGALVVHHDAVIEGLGALEELAVASLPPQVPLLGTALEACEGMIVNIEIKPVADQAAAERLAREVVAVALELRDPADLVVSSFDPSILDAVRMADPDVATGWLLVPGADVLGMLAPALERGFDALHPFVTSVSPSTLDACHDAGIALNVWTVNGRGELASLAAMAVDGLITDDVALAREVLDGLGAGSR